jgi:hypothetical protein
MRIRLLALSSILILALASAALAADINGKWKATLESQMGSMEMNFAFKVDAEKITGTMSSEMMGEQQISEGVIKGDVVSFAVAMEGPMGAMKITYKGKVAGDEMKLTMQFGDREGRELTLTLVK